MAHFYATKQDLVPILVGAESAEPLKYVLMGRFLTPTIQSYSRWDDIPNLGVASSSSAIGCTSFLVCEPELAINLDIVNQSDGVRSYHINQLYNPDTITFLTGGLWKSEILLYGRFATVSASFSKTAKRLMQRFDYQVRKHFVKIDGYYVGPEGVEMLKQGKRLAMAEQTPKEFDLKLPE